MFIPASRGFKTSNHHLGIVKEETRQLLKADNLEVYIAFSFN